MSTEIIGPLGRPLRPLRLSHRSALWDRCSVLLYVHRNHRTVRAATSATSTFTQIMSSSSPLLLFLSFWMGVGWGEVRSGMEGTVVCSWTMRHRVLIRKWFSFVRFGMCCSFYAIGSRPEFKNKKIEHRNEVLGLLSHFTSCRVFFFLWGGGGGPPSTSFFLNTDLKTKQKTVIRSLACRGTRTCCLHRGLSTKIKTGCCFLFLFFWFVWGFCWGGFAACITDESKNRRSDTFSVLTLRSVWKKFTQISGTNGWWITLLNSSTNVTKRGDTYKETGRIETPFKHQASFIPCLTPLPGLPFHSQHDSRLTVQKGMRRTLCTTVKRAKVWLDYHKRIYVDCFYRERDNITDRTTKTTAYNQNPNPRTSNSSEQSWFKWMCHLRRID